MINEPRLKTESFVMCFLFFLSLKTTLKKNLSLQFSPLFLELKNHYKHVLDSPWYISGFQTVFLWRFRQGTVTIRLQSFSQFRVIITLYEMINEPRLKTETFVMCFLFFLSLKSILKTTLLPDGHNILQSINGGFKIATLFFCFFSVVLNASYEIQTCLLLNDFISCYHVAFMYYFVPRVDVNRAGVGVPISNAESTLSVAQWSLP